MALKALVKDIAEVPEGLRTEYTQTEEGWVLNVEDSDYKKKLEEFRTNNRELYNKRKELETKLETYKEVDPAKYKEAVKALEHLDKSEDAMLIKEGKWEDVIKKRTENLRNSYEQQLSAKDQMLRSLTDEAGQYKGKYAELLVDTQISNTVTAIAQPKKGALTDILLRARREWTVEDGKLKGRDLFNDKGEPMSPEDWGKKLVAENGYLFEPSQGGGAQGGAKKQGAAQGGKIVVDRNDPLAKGKYMKELAAGTAVLSES